MEVTIQTIEGLQALLKQKDAALQRERALLRKAHEDAIKGSLATLAFMPSP